MTDRRGVLTASLSSLCVLMDQPQVITQQFVGNRWIFNNVGRHVEHDRVPGTSRRSIRMQHVERPAFALSELQFQGLRCHRLLDRKSTRLNSSHGYISY